MTNEQKTPILNGISALLSLLFMIFFVMLIFEKPLYRLLGISTWIYSESENDKMYPELGVYKVQTNPDEILNFDRILFYCDTRIKSKPIVYAAWENSEAGRYSPIKLEIKPDKGDLVVKNYDIYDSNVTYAPPDLIIRTQEENYSRGLFLIGDNAIDFYLTIKDMSKATLKSGNASNNFRLQGLDEEFQKWLTNCPSADAILKKKIEKRNKSKR